MIYSSRAKGQDAMASAIRDADHFVYLMGISLREFFLIEAPCSNAISEVYSARKGIDFKILILNNRSPEALERSSREEGLTYNDIGDPEYESRTLFRQTSQTIIGIQRHYPTMSRRVYDNQSLFLLITDKVAFVAPYHDIERVVDITMRARVAELMPLTEYRKVSTRGPYEHFLGHFIHVFETAREPSAANTQI